MYLDLNHIISMARVISGHRAADARYGRLLRSALSAAAEHRALFPLGEGHVWEILKIADPRHRRALVEVLEPLSGFQYMLDRVTLAELELGAGIRAIRGTATDPLDYMPLLRPTVGNALGIVGGLQIVGENGKDVTDKTRRQVGARDFDRLMNILNIEFERGMLQGPTDEEALELRIKYGYRPEDALAGHESRVDFERDTARRLDEHPEWRSGRLRDFVAAREFSHEWLGMINRVLASEATASGDAHDLTDDEARALMSAMPHAQVAISLKTRYHQDAAHRWTPNDVTDIDFLSAAFAYCDAVFTDKAARNALRMSKELRQFPTFVPREVGELTDWLDALPAIPTWDLLVPHPTPRPATGHSESPPSEGGAASGT